MHEQVHTVLLGVHRGLDYRDAYLSVCCSHKKTLKPLITGFCMCEERDREKEWYFVFVRDRDGNKNC